MGAMLSCQRGPKTLSSSGPKAVPAAAYNPAVDGPRDFGLGEHYEVRKLLGEGACGQAWLCLTPQQKPVAIKFLPRPISENDLPGLMREIKVQAKLGDGHVNLVAAKAVVLTDTHLGIVMEYAAGGNLVEHIKKEWDTRDEREGLIVPEDKARYFIRQLVDAVTFLHANNVAHRDLKLDNIVLDGSNPPRLKVCDFGYSDCWEADANMYGQVGTPVYMSPQLIKCDVDRTPYDAAKADVWACGVTLFAMQMSMFPYDHDPDMDPQTQTQEAQAEIWLQHHQYRWHDREEVLGCREKLSAECCDLLDKMLERDEQRRPTLARLKQHRWLTAALPCKLQAALDKMAQEQSARSSMATGARILDPEHMQELEQLLQEAGSAPTASGMYRSLDLAYLYRVVSDQPMPGSVVQAQAQGQALEQAQEWAQAQRQVQVQAQAQGHEQAHGLEQGQEQAPSALDRAEASKTASFTFAVAAATRQPGTTAAGESPCDGFAPTPSLAQSHVVHSEPCSAVVAQQASLALDAGAGSSMSLVPQSAVDAPPATSSAQAVPLSQSSESGASVSCALSSTSGHAPSSPAGAAAPSSTSGSTSGSMAQDVTSAQPKPQLAGSGQDLQDTFQDTFMPVQQPTPADAAAESASAANFVVSAALLQADDTAAATEQQVDIQSTWSLMQQLVYATGNENTYRSVSSPGLMPSQAAQPPLFHLEAVAGNLGQTVGSARESATSGGSKGGALCTAKAGAAGTAGVVAGDVAGCVPAQVCQA